MVERILEHANLPDQESDQDLFKENSVAVVLDGIEIHTTDMCSEQNYSIEEIGDCSQSEFQKVKEELFQLRMELKNLNDFRIQEKQQLLNEMKLMEENISKKIEAVHESIIKTLALHIDPTRASSEVVIDQVENSQDLLPVGLEIDNRCHLGESIWVDAATLKHIRLYSDSASKFVGNLVELIYTPEILRSHTVTGTQCNANKGLPAKPKLCSVKYGVALAEYKRWLKEQIMTDEERKKKLSCFNRYISSKQGTLNSDPMQRPEKRKSNITDKDLKKVRRKVKTPKEEEEMEDNAQEEVYGNEGEIIRVNHVESTAVMDDPSFQESFRLTRQSFELLLRDVGPVLKADTKNLDRPEIAIERTLLLALWSLGNPETFGSVAERFGMADNCAHETFCKVMNAMVAMSPFYLNWPTEHEIARIKHDFDEYGSFPNVVGVVGATRMPIFTNKINCDRKPVQTVTLQGICDANLCFLDVAAVCPGHGNVLDIWKRSLIARTLEEDKLGLQDEYHLVGGSDYVLKTYFMVPYKNYLQLTLEQENFNLELCAKSILIKKAFGKLRGRFRKLDSLNLAKFDEITSIVKAACVLHNMCIKYNDQLEFEDLNDEELEVSEFVEGSKNDVESDAALQKRNQIADFLYRD